MHISKQSRIARLLMAYKGEKVKSMNGRSLVLACVQMLRMRQGRWSWSTARDYVAVERSPSTRCNVLWISGLDMPRRLAKPEPEMLGDGPRQIFSVPPERRMGWCDSS